MRPQALLLLLAILSITISGCAHQQTPTSYGEVSLHFCHLVDCNEVLTELIIGADKVSCAFYELDHPVVRAALINKGARVIIDEDAEAFAGARVRTGEGLMHHKFCVLDKEVVVTGSFNPVTGSNHDYNNLVVIESRTIAKRYERIFEGKRTRRQAFLHNGHQVLVYDCPQDGCAKEMRSLLQAAEKTISFALFTFTDKEVASVLIERHEKGVEVKGVIESFQARSYNQYFPLWEEGLEVALETSDRLQHNKLFVIDHETIITGSYNPTRSADTINEENIIVIKDASIAQAYEAFIEQLFKKTQTFK